jgi:hypothetical protein
LREAGALPNITLSVDEAIIKKIRKIAVDKNTTLTEMVRKFPRLVAESELAQGSSLQGNPMPSRQCPETLEEAILFHDPSPPEMAKNLFPITSFREPRSKGFETNPGLNASRFGFGSPPGASGRYSL